MSKPFSSSHELRQALALIPVTKPVYARCREMLQARYPHPVV